MLYHIIDVMLLCKAKIYLFDFYCLFFSIYSTFFQVFRGRDEFFTFFHPSGSNLTLNSKNRGVSSDGCVSIKEQRCSKKPTTAI